MKAIVYEQYGSPDLLQLTDIEKPIPASNQILIKIHAVSINGSDRESLIGKPLYARMGGLFKPGESILGGDIAGVVEAVGEEHTEFSVGDAVFGEIPGYRGGFAEYVCTSGQTMTHKPESLTFEQAAAIPQAGVIAWNGISKQGNVQPGQSVLINGGGGSGGSFAIQLAKHLGADVTGVDNQHKLDYMRSLGADHVVNYTQENFTKTGQQYDVILDLIAHRSAFAYARALRPKGTYSMVGGSVSTLFQALLFRPSIKRVTGKTVRLLAVPQNRPDLLAITELIEAGQIGVSIDQTFAFEETPEAMRYVESGQSKGKVVIRVVEAN